ncbi:MAG: type II toxin-antitoxin system RelE/ParE family toxin [Candidatus Aminicenantes bacterium]|nr:type II toxin-antitoxin system RelE/ParE family toxin [Candidatus Aminicenantes bacterium]
MAYRIVYKKSVSRDLSKLDKQEARRILNKIEQELTQKAASFPVLKGKFAGLRKYRIGDYRVIYAIVESDVRILRIGDRQDVYKKKI